MSSKKSAQTLFLPQLLDKNPGPWHSEEVPIGESSVVLSEQQAFVPKAYTEAQRLARIHELGHVKETPRSWPKVAAEITDSHPDVPMDVNKLIKLSQMLEENRVDWILWDRYGHDIRPAREVLSWVGMDVRDDPYLALCQVLQLAWTVWASRGLPAVPGLENRPPVRNGDADVGVYFDTCWTVLCEYSRPLAMLALQGCLEIYADPIHEVRNKVAAALGAYFPPVEEKIELPPEKEEEKAKQRDAAEAEARKDEKKQRDEEGDKDEPAALTRKGHYDIHDHTHNIRRPSVRINRREVAVSSGTKLSFPHRYVLDKAVFGRRLVTEGGIMVDGSSSMRWTQEAMIELMNRLPAVWIGLYHGMRPQKYGDGTARICILAKQGRFSKFTGYDEGYCGENAVDVEALQLLARWPRPRFWLSDGIVAEGINVGKHPVEKHNTTNYMELYGNIVHLADRVMRAGDILRVPDLETMLDLIQRKRVTLYRSCCNKQADARRPGHLSATWPESMSDQPVSFQL